MKFIKFHKVNILFLLKTGIGSGLAIIIANVLGLMYSPSAGIITLLTIQNTKKETLKITGKRIFAFVLAVISASIMFHTIGYTPVAFGGFVFLFVALCTIFGVKDGIAMNAVLTTHFLIEQRMDFMFLLNEISLLMIGMSIGILINLIMPKNRARFRSEQMDLDTEIKNTLSNISNMLTNKELCLIQREAAETAKTSNTVASSQGISTMEVDFDYIDQKIDRLIKKAYEEAENTFLSDTTYMISYLEMRKQQIDVLKDMVLLIQQVPVLLRQTYPIAEFIDRTANSFHESNNAKELLTEMKELYAFYREDSLPSTREEFEYRAILYQVLKQLEYFLRLKRNFMKEMESMNLKAYWGYDDIT